MFHHSSKEHKSLVGMSSGYCFQCKQKEIRIKSLEKELATTVDKQHEAMGRALQLAERNQHLERELKDIDHMALEVEAECQNKVKQNLKNMDILQHRLKQKIDENKNLEEVLFNVKSKVKVNEQELVNLKTEKKLLEENLNIVINEKKHLHDKINNFVLIEKNLNVKAARLQEINKALHQQIKAMEEKMMDVLKQATREGKEKLKKINPTLGLPCSKLITLSNHGHLPSEMIKESENWCSENQFFHINSNSLTNILENDKCINKNKSYTLLHQLKNSDWGTNIIKLLEDKDKEISSLKDQILILKPTNPEVFGHCNFNEHIISSSEKSIKVLLDKLEKERDDALTDISRLQGEKNALKEKMKSLTESHVAELSRLERISKENEERIRRLESERRELISSQSTQRLALTNAEEKLDECQGKNRNALKELSQMSANYNQLKILQEQTDRSLSEVQGRLIQADGELKLVEEKARELQRTNANLEDEIRFLKNEHVTLKTNLALAEKEKDGLLINLDEKTENVASLENQLKDQDNYISELKENFSLLQKKFEFAESERTNRELSFRALEQTLEHLKEEMQACELQKDSLVRENRRLQEDLASASKDCLAVQKEWEREKQEVENLKKQLQQYFGEVKKAEDLLSKKECERNQMLEHFRCLSLEATALESNNHSLESAIENTKSELISANSKIIDLEQQADLKDSLLSNYEKQIAGLTSQIAEMELKLKLESESKARTEEDLFALRNLCSTIDDQKETFKRQADTCEAERFRLSNEVRRLSEEYETLSQKFSRERNNSQALEKSLSNSRQETLEHKITNKDLQAQVEHLKQKVNELTEKWEAESKDVKRYQSQCADLCQQVGELRREVTNARFQQAKAVEGSRRKFLPNIPDEEHEEGKFETKSPRNVPPLPLREDSDATASFESDEDFVRFFFEKTSNSFRKSLWGLSPLPENMEGKSPEFDASLADSASDLSSLPDDSGSKRPTSYDFAACPTYSVRSRSDLDEEQRRFFLSTREEGATEEEPRRQTVASGPSEPPGRKILGCSSKSSDSFRASSFPDSEISPKFLLEGHMSIVDEGSSGFAAVESAKDNHKSSHQANAL